MITTSLSPVNASNEWSPLKSVIVGRAGRSCFPSAPAPMIRSTMPSDHVHRFDSHAPFDPHLIAKAEAEPDYFSAILKEHCVQVYTPPAGIDWVQLGGCSGAMPRDGLMSVGNTLIKACFAWPCRGSAAVHDESATVLECSCSRWEKGCCRG